MGGISYAQNSTLKGRVTEMDGKTPIESVTVRLMQDNKLVTGAATDQNGYYTIKLIPAGKYDLVATSVGYAKWTKTGFEIRANQIKIEDIKLQSSSAALTEVVVTATQELFDPSNSASQQVGTAEEIKNTGGKSVSDLLTTMSGVTVGSGGGMNVRGNREDQTAYYVDGVRTSVVPNGAIGEFAFISGSLPAKYGDATSVVEIETKGTRQEFMGNVDLYGSIDGYNGFGLRFDVVGPIVKRKDIIKNIDNGSSKKNDFISVGFLLSGEAARSTGGSVRGGLYVASQETIDYLKANPLRTVDGSTVSTANNLNYVTMYEEGNILSLAKKKSHRRQHSGGYSAALQGKIDIRTKSVDFMISGNLQGADSRSFSFANSLFNSDNNGRSQSLLWNVNARLTHRINFSDSSKIQNAYYRLQGFYQQTDARTFSHIHRDRLFEYGYIGKYDHTLSKYYKEVTNQAVPRADGSGIDTLDVPYVLETFYVSDVKFTPSDLNTDLAQYTLGAYERAGGIMTNDNEITTYKGLLNGGSPSGAYGLFSAPGVTYNGYAKSRSSRMEFKALVSFDIKGRNGNDHAVEFGFSFFQTIGRSFSVSPRGLWTLMRQISNQHIEDLDRSNPLPKYDENGIFMDTVDFNRLVSTEAQATFDKSLRTKLGAADDEWIDVDAYEPSMYSLDMFSPEDLFNQGSSYVSYYGYDYIGKTRTSKGITMSDVKNWFNESDPSSTRDFSMIGASKPIRMAAYIQDRFAIKTLYFSLGLRLDVFDQNQPYVKDMFLYRDAYTVKEAQNNGLLSEATIPDFMNQSDDYYVYVKDASASAADMEVTAFRSGNVWYDANGQEVTDAAELASSAGQTNLVPLLKTLPGDKDVTKVNYTAFADYTPTFKNGGITLSPRLSFSFVVGDNSLFSASYNIVTTSQQQRFNPLSYLYFEKYASNSSTFANPGLKPERSVDYEIGFQQALSKTFAVEVRAYYSEKRDQVVVYHYNQAYPTSYYSYTNMDFGTVQGFTFGLKMLRTKNISFNTSYTIQFAKGTGSDPTSTLALIRSGQPNLRTLTTLSYDQRHKINFNFQYVFGFGEDYVKNNGPVTRKAIKNTDKVKEIKWLQGAGLSLQLGVGSGLPYTRSSVAYSSIVGQGQRSVEGGINGSRMPWVVDCDLNVWKDFILVLRKADDSGKKQKNGYLRVNVALKNLFNIKKVRSVYSYTGSPVDDGFLTASDYQQYIASQENVQSFIDYYTIAMQGVNNYGAPIRAELGVSFSF